jgi:Flp pilus assembly protein TadD
MTNPRRAGVAVATLLALVVTPGCATWHGARLYQSGTRALEQGDVDRALDDLSRAARLVPQASEIQNHLGLAWLRAGDEAEALRTFERAVELDCDNRAAGDNLARLEARLQRREREAALEEISASAEAPLPEPGRGASGPGPDLTSDPSDAKSRATTLE